MQRVEFQLTMPGKNSWNGKWSGEDKFFAIYKNMTEKKVKELELSEEVKQYGYSWGDGWRASIKVRILKKGEKKKKSEGFCGYNWMVSNIVMYGSAYGKDE